MPSVSPTSSVEVDAAHGRYRRRARRVVGHAQVADLEEAHLCRSLSRGSRISSSAVPQSVNASATSRMPRPGGMNDPPGLRCDRARLERVVEHLAPGRVRRVAEAEEGERGLGEDHDRHRERRVREDQRRDVRDDVARHQMPVRRAERAAAVDVVALPEGQHLGADQPGGRGPRGDPDHQDDVAHRRAEDGREHDGQRQERDHEEPLRDAHQDAADLAAVEAGGDPDDRSDQDREDRRREAHEQARPRAPDELRHDVAAETVRPQRAELRGVREGRVVRRVDRAEARLVGEQGRSDRHQHGGHEDPQPDHPRPVVAELAPRPRQRPPAADPGDPPGGWGRDGAHVGLTRGSR